MIKINSIVSVLPKNQIIIKSNKNKVKNYSGFNKLNVLSKEDTIQDLIFFSIQKLIQNSKFNLNKIDSIIFSSHSRELEMPSISALIQKKLNLKNKIFCYDLPLSCSAFPYSLIHAYSLIHSNLSKNILLVCGDSLSKFISKNDKNLKYITGDSFSSCIISKDSKNKFKFDYGCDGDDKILNLDFKRKNKLKMNGLKVMHFATTTVYDHINDFVKKENISKENIYTCFHQPNLTIHNYLVNKLGFAKKNNIANFNHGNTSAGTIPLALSKHFQKNKYLKKDILLSGFGEGMMWATCLINLKKTNFIGVKYY